MTPHAGSPPAAEAGPSPAADAAAAAALLAVDPAGLGGAVLRAAPGPVRDRWLALLRAAMPPSAPFRRLPLNAPDSRLLGGLDLAATLAAGRPVAERGVLAEADGGIVVLAMAERVEAATAARLAAVLDTGEVAVQRDGLSLRLAARIGIVALDEGVGEDEATQAALRERLGFRLSLDDLPQQEAFAWAPVAPADVQAARAALATIAAPDAIVTALCGAAMALGIDSVRAPLLALRAARAAAALAGRTTIAEADVALAARLVLGPRATRLPPQEAPPEDAPPPEQQAEEQAADAPPPPPEGGESEQEAPPDPAALQEMLLAAAQASMPSGLLAALGLHAREAARRAGAAAGRAGAQRLSKQRGRPIGTRPGALRAGARLALVDTLRAAAPWQPLRRREGRPGPLIRVTRDDIRLLRFKQNTETTAIFVVDASGSSALNRLAEAKGAVELLLADCYVRRDQVAVVAFRGVAAEVLLPPTSSLVRAKRSLAGLPGGGATPLASGIDVATSLALEAGRRGRSALLVLLTDGRANIGRDGKPGRPQAEADALAAAAQIRAARIPALVVDTAPRPAPYARALAEAMGGRYLALPSADSHRLSDAVAAAREAA